MNTVEPFSLASSRAISAGIPWVMIPMFPVAQLRISGVILKLQVFLPIL
jgi:hypothetical protein